MESIDNKDESKKGESKFNQEIHSKVVRAGKRTYFFDVKTTRNDEYYLTITESKKHFDENGKYHFEKHKIFLYKEDFEKFSNGLNEVIGFILEKQPYEAYEKQEDSAAPEKTAVPNFSDVDFGDI